MIKKKSTTLPLFILLAIEIDANPIQIFILLE